MCAKRSMQPDDIGSFIRGYLQRMDKDDINAQLVRMWSSWEEVLGPEMADMLKPLGHKKSLLILGCEDSLVMQEMNYFENQILAHVNTFLGLEYFDKVRLELLQNRTPLDHIRPGLDARRHLPEHPGKLGGLLGKFAKDSPVNRCYQKYVAYFRMRDR